MSTVATPKNEQDRPALSPDAVSLCLLWSSLLLALIALVGSLSLSIGMGLKACPLCLYQRTFVMGVVGVLVLGVLTGARHWGVLNLLALPLALAAAAVAVFHEYLEQTGKLECPGGILGIGTAPQQSLMVLALLLLQIAGGVLWNVRARELFWPTSLAGLVLGLLFALAAVASAPPPIIPTKPYDPEKQPLDGCRVPFPPP